MFYTFVGSEIGDLLVARDEADAITALHFSGGRPEDGWRRSDSRFTDVADQLRAYFLGQLRDFTLALAPRGTPFQLSVWNALRSIPYGETRSYGEIARSVGRPTAFRAVGAANGANPIPIIIPCHRVIGSGGSLTGFGGGIEVKKRLLGLEAAATAPLFRRVLPLAPRAR